MRLGSEEDISQCTRHVRFGSQADICSAKRHVRPNSDRKSGQAWRDVTFHGLRRTHASQLIDPGVDIVTVSRRLGHAKPDITLRIYAQPFRKDDSKASEAINAILGS